MTKMTLTGQDGTQALLVLEAAKIGPIPALQLRPTRPAPAPPHPPPLMRPTILDLLRLILHIGVLRLLLLLLLLATPRLPTRRLAQLQSHHFLTLKLILI